MRGLVCYILKIMALTAAIFIADCSICGGRFEVGALHRTLSAAEQKQMLPDSEEVDFTIEDVRALFPDAAHLAPAPDHEVLRVKDEDDHLIGYIALGPPEDEDITGHTGPVPFLIGFDPDFNVRRVYMLSNLETPYYSRKVSESLEDAWRGMRPGEAIEAQVDAVSGATQTSEALIRGVNKTLEQSFDKQHERELHFTPLRLPELKDLLVLGFLAVALLYFFLPLSSRRRRILLNIFSVLIPGIFTATMLYLPLFQGWIGSSFTWSRHWLLVIIVIFAFGIPLLKGRNFYCYYFCPFGAAQELINRLFKKKWRPGKRITFFLKAARALILATAIAVVITGAALDLSLFEPFIVFRWFYAPWFSRGLAIFFLLLSVFIARPWCRVCPTGGLISIVVIRKKKKAS